MEIGDLIVLEHFFCETVSIWNTYETKQPTFQSYLPIENKRIMPRNVEIKAYVDDLEALKTKACELSNDGKGQIIEQRDTFFNVPNGNIFMKKCKNM